MAWAKTEQILRQTYALMEGNGMTNGAAVCDALQISQDEARADFEALDDAGYIAATFAANGFPQLIRPAEKGLQCCSGWPESGGAPAFLAEFLKAVDTRANDAATSEEEKSRLKRFGEAAGGVGKDVLSEIVAKVVTGA